LSVIFGRAERSLTCLSERHFMSTHSSRRITTIGRVTLWY
jgi:hypothetical protein